MGEGQWQVDDRIRARIDELDIDSENAVKVGDEQAVQAVLRAIHELVRSSGERLDHAHLGASDLVVPPADLSLDEARELLHGEGLIPELP
jgi:hypothetical protein